MMTDSPRFRPSPAPRRRRATADGSLPAAAMATENAPPFLTMRRRRGTARLRRATVGRVLGRGGAGRNVGEPLRESYHEATPVLVPWREAVRGREGPAGPADPQAVRDDRADAPATSEVLEVTPDRIHALGRPASEEGVELLRTMTTGPAGSTRQAIVVEERGLRHDRLEERAAARDDRQVAALPRPDPSPRPGLLQALHPDPWGRGHREPSGGTEDEGHTRARFLEAGHHASREPIGRRWARVPQEPPTPVRAARTGSEPVGPNRPDLDGFGELPRERGDRAEGREQRQQVRPV